MHSVQVHTISIIMHGSRAVYLQCRNWVDSLKQTCTSFITYTHCALIQYRCHVLSIYSLCCSCFYSNPSLTIFLCQSFSVIVGWCSVYVASPHYWSHWWTERKHSLHLHYNLSPSSLSCSSCCHWKSGLVLVQLEVVAIDTWSKSKEIVHNWYTWLK